MRNQHNSNFLSRVPRVSLYKHKLIQYPDDPGGYLSQCWVTDWEEEEGISSWAPKHLAHGLRAAQGAAPPPGRVRTVGQWQIQGGEVSSQHLSTHQGLLLLATFWALAPVDPQWAGMNQPTLRWFYWGDRNGAFPEHWVMRHVMLGSTWSFKPEDLISWFPGLTRETNTQEIPERSPTSSNRVTGEPNFPRILLL